MPHSRLTSELMSKAEALEHATEFVNRLPLPRFHDYEVADLRKLAVALKTGRGLGLPQERHALLMPVVEIGIRVFRHYRDAVFSRAGLLTIVEHSIDDLARQDLKNLTDAGEALESLIGTIPASQIEVTRDGSEA